MATTLQSKQMKLIAAMDIGGVISKDGVIPWDIPEERLHFKDTTWGQQVIYGRVTAETIGKPLENRTNIVLSRHPKTIPNFEDYTYCGSIEEAVRKYPDAWVAGGAEIYQQFMPYVKEMILTHIQNIYTKFADPETDKVKRFPVVQPIQWNIKLLRAHKDYRITRWIKQ